MFRTLAGLSAMVFAAEMDFHEVKIPTKQTVSVSRKRVPQTKGKRQISQKARSNRRKAKRRK